MSGFLKTLKVFLLLFVITGVIYPLLTTGIASFMFREKTKGSIIYYKGKPVGSELIGQPFISDYLFWGRPSADNYDPLNSGGSNLAPTNPELYKQIKARIERLRNSGIKEKISSYLVFSSGSGLDPHLPPEALLIQIPRISERTGLSKDELERLVIKNTEERSFGFFGERRVNVLKLNLDLLSLLESHGNRRLP
ncbi:potassium-transporting ATPase subunit KdpC [Hydrogenobacter thermophilus]|uniref:potassium-transporting ATPase subunit KdpC n=1 Tax=Hydrogenobacter thermophilus TaxID=940 RepID=UPI0030F7D446